MPKTGTVYERWDAMDDDAQGELFYTVMRDLDIYPEHNGLEAVWGDYLSVIAREITIRLCK
jgi:hypothetical protein